MLRDRAELLCLASTLQAISATCDEDFGKIPECPIEQSVDAPVIAKPCEAHQAASRPESREENPRLQNRNRCGLGAPGRHQLIGAEVPATGSLVLLWSPYPECSDGLHWGR